MKRGRILIFGYNIREDFCRLPAAIFVDVISSGETVAYNTHHYHRFRTAYHRYVSE